MRLLQLLLKRKIIVGLLFVFVLITGSFATIKLDKELMPPVDFDGAFIDVMAGEMNAFEVERLITIPVEQRLSGIEGVEEVNSTTNIGRASLQLTFESGRGDEVYREVESAINSMKPELTGVEDLLTYKMSTNQPFEYYMDLSDGSMEEMTKFAIETLKPRLEALPEVREVDLMGLEENEVLIELDRDRLLEYQLDPSQIIGIIQNENTEASLGVLSEEENQPTLRWNTSFTSVKDLENLQIPTVNGIEPLDTFADIKLQPIENTSSVWKEGSNEFVFIQIGRVADITQIELTEAIRAELEAIRDEGHVQGFEMNEVIALSDYVEDSIDGVTDNIIIGAIVALAILLLFLRNIRATIIIGLSIPTSVLLTFLSMWLLDYSFNMLSLIALGLGIGMMVDSSIVILESIYRKKEQGYENVQAVLEGAREVATAVFASMLTTIVVFLPVGLMGGEVGKFMIILSIVVSATLISSVIIAFTLIPTLSENFLRLKMKREHQKESFIVRRYGKTVGWMAKKKRNRFGMIGLFFIVLVSSLFLVMKIPMTIMPDIFNRYAELVINLEPGVDLDDRREIVEDINERLSAVQDVDSHYVIDNGNMFYIPINMTKDDEVTREQKDVNEDILRTLREMIDERPIKSVDSTTSAGAGSPVQINVKGEDFEGLRLITEDLKEELKDIDGIVGVTSTNERQSQEQKVVLKENAIKEDGLTTQQIKQSIEQLSMDMPVGEMKTEGEMIPIKLGIDEKLTTQDDLLDLEISTPGGMEKLSKYVELETVEVPNQISHVDGERFVTIQADIEGRDLGSINRDVQKVIDSYDPSSGYTVDTAGDLEQQQELIQEMIMILLIAIFLVYVVMAIQFNNLAHPLVVMSVIPMTVVGVILGLFITQSELSTMSGMGIIMLIGIVLNNAILLIDRTKQLRNAGYNSSDALVEAGKNRMRPIFMTTLTTAGAMLPLAFATGASGGYQAPLAIVVISGLLFATMITLILIPAVYLLYSDIGRGFRRIFKRKLKKEKETAEQVG
ncbi:efflux RND transporter permease subunit [Pseudalkalibacillus salsuginis]|uniref:efflux RND transporter permease subunit n=1 Tax=Pseudalkalibacillus salsuginis TaxID=2910972 RepID=UPI001F157B4D|nr:efflux RND transporter permease subunit [Pseudalkalibacillus salsuginis]MCF6411314.1 efflux RND transporter permease subunit [Pseudalkalibacillus salsuginis]